MVSSLQRTSGRFIPRYLRALDLTILLSRPFFDSLRIQQNQAAVFKESLN
jgi:hypothetical protein